MGLTGEHKESVDSDTNQKEVALGEQKEVISTSSDSLPGEVLEPQFDQSRTKTLIRKLDWHLVPFLALLYL